jgi:Rrf2 family nitric oxide-sensitive transcriptional repressor
MKATFHTDYALRLLIYLLLHPEERVSTRTVAEAYEVSLNHLNKVSQHLVQLGLLDATRGRGGGVVLAEGAREWKLGDLVRQLEPDGELVQCAGGGSNEPCKIAPACHLRSIFAGATEAFYAKLNQYKVADLIAKNGVAMRRLISQ